jgi:hypothetical protein
MAWPTREAGDSCCVGSTAGSNLGQGEIKSDETRKRLCAAIPMTPAQDLRSSRVLQQRSDVRDLRRVRDAVDPRDQAVSGFEREDSNQAVVQEGKRSRIPVDRHRDQADALGSDVPLETAELIVGFTARSPRSNRR